MEDFPQWDNRPPSHGPRVVRMPACKFLVSYTSSPYKEAFHEVAVLLVL